jgi:hypothetical protein
MFTTTAVILIVGIARCLKATALVAILAPVLIVIGSGSNGNTGYARYERLADKDTRIF